MTVNLWISKHCFCKHYQFNTTLDALRYTVKTQEEGDFIYDLTQKFESYDRLVTAVSNASIESTEKVKEVWSKKERSIIKLTKTIDKLLGIDKIQKEKKSA